MPPARCRPPAISLLHTTNNQIANRVSNLNYLGRLRPTREGLVGAASDGEEVLDDMLAVGGLSTAALAQ